MQLTCPSCGTTFSIPDGALGEAGRSVKCSRCQHVWHATVDGAVPEQSAEVGGPAAAAPVSGAPEADPITTDPKPASGPDSVPSRKDEFSGIIAPFKEKVADESVPSWDRPLPGVGIEAAPEPGRPWTRVIVATVLMLFVAVTYILRNEIVAVAPSFKPLYSLAGIPLRQAGEGLAFVDLASGAAVDNPDMLRVTGFIQNTSDMRRRIPPVRIVVYDTEKNMLADVVREPPAEVLDPRDLQRFTYDLPSPVKPLKGLFVDVLFTWH